MTLKEGRSYRWGKYTFTSTPSYLSDPADIAAVKSIGCLHVEEERDAPAPAKPAVKGKAGAKSPTPMPPADDDSGEGEGETAENTPPSKPGKPTPPKAGKKE